MSDLISRQQAIEAVGNMLRRKFGIGGDLAEITLACLPSVQPETNCSEIPNNSDTISRQQAINKIKPWLEVKGYGWSELNMLRAVINELENMPSIQPERKDAIEKAVAVEAISDELMSRFDVSATYGYDFAEAVINRIEAMAKELERGEQE